MKQQYKDAFNQAYKNITTSADKISISKGTNYKVFVPMTVVVRELNNFVDKINKDKNKINNKTKKRK